jgi:hypothetical protein
MAVEARSQRLLDAVKKLPPDEFDALIADALALRRPSQSPRLSAAETRLLKRINRGLPATFCERYARLRAQLKKGTLTPEAHQELLRLTGEAERRDAERAAALFELATLRGVPVRGLMKQLGIQAPPVHG